MTVLRMEKHNDVCRNGRKSAIRRSDICGHSRFEEVEESEAHENHECHWRIALETPYMLC